MTTLLLITFHTRKCHTRCLVDGTAAQAMVTIVERRDLALSDGFVRFIKRDVYGVRGPALAHRNRDRGHAMADLCTRPKALMRKRGSWWRVAPYPLEIIRCNIRGEQCWVTASNASQRTNKHRRREQKRTGRGGGKGKRKAAPTLGRRRRSRSFDDSYRRQRASWLDLGVSRLGRLCKSTDRCAGPIQSLC